MSGAWPPHVGCGQVEQLPACKYQAWRFGRSGPVLPSWCARGNCSPRVSGDDSIVRRIGARFPANAGRCTISFRVGFNLKSFSISMLVDDFAFSGACRWPHYDVILLPSNFAATGMDLVSACICHQSELSIQRAGATSTIASKLACPTVNSNKSRAWSGRTGSPEVSALSPGQPSRIHTVPAGMRSVT